MTDDRERALFEAWAENNGYDLKMFYNKHVYMHSGAEMAWLVWQARADIARREAGAWQPIETAPRDGTWFVAACDDTKWNVLPRIVRFKDKYDRYPISDPGVVWTIAPTHWMPLPAPPAALAATP